MKNVWIAALLILLVVIGCRLPSSLTKKTANENAPDAKQQADSKSENVSDTDIPAGDPREELLASARKFKDLPFFAATLTGDGVRNVNGRLEYVAPDKYRFLNIGGPTAGIEFVIIGKQTYIKSGGKWNRFPVDIGSQIPSVREFLEEQEIQRIKTIKRENDDTADGIPAAVYVYEGSTPSKAVHYRSRLWIDKATRLPLKLVVEYDGGDLKSMTITYDTTTPITIESPMQ
jgi:hypothetical protein